MKEEEMPKRTKCFYTFTEKKRGGVRRRISDHRYTEKAKAAEMARVMRHLYGDRFTYSVVKVPAVVRPSR